MEVQAGDNGLLAVNFIEEQQQQPAVASNSIAERTVTLLQAYFAGKKVVFDLPLTPVGTPFQQSVWQQLQQIPYGKTSTYSAVAQLLNNPLSVRAVGTANGQNPIAIIIPCHRVIGADGSLTGYAGGLWRKERLLILEGFLKEQKSLW